MAKFNDLIKTDPQLAAGILQQSFIHVVNNMIPNIYLTKDEFKELVKIILAGEAKDPDEVEDTEDNVTGEDNKGADDAEDGTP